MWRAFNKVTLQVMQVFYLQINFRICQTLLMLLWPTKTSPLCRSVKAAGLETELAKQGPFTVFAPSEMAFGKLGSGVLTDWMNPENKIKFAGILNPSISVVFLLSSNQ